MLLLMILLFIEVDIIDSLIKYKSKLKKKKKVGHLFFSDYITDDFPPFMQVLSSLNGIRNNSARIFSKAE